MRPLIAASALLVLTACAASGHRAEVEALLGHRVPDWPAYHETALRRCELDRAAFAEQLTRDATDNPAWLAVKTDVRILCPDRIQEIISWERSHGPVR